MNTAFPIVAAEGSPGRQKNAGDCALIEIHTAKPAWAERPGLAGLDRRKL
jgi:hypothetical protein